MITVILGTKAQVIKMAPVMVELEKRGLPWRWIFTGQHRDTIAELQRDFGLRLPDAQLYHGPDITRVGQMVWWSLRILTIFLRRRHELIPDPKNTIVMVHGDTLSTVIGALAGRLLGCRVAHVESGLTSERLLQPFPEEIQRRIVFRLANIFFCPGEWAMERVRSRHGEKINTLQNTLIESLAMVESATQPEPHSATYYLVNFHRYENLRDERRMRWIVEQILWTAEQGPVIIVLHQPTEQALKKFHLFERLSEHPAITLKPRMTYLEFIRLLRGSRLLITDGGSNQEECYYLGHPCLLMREVTERPEGIGENVVVSAFNTEIFRTVVVEPQRLIRQTVTTNSRPAAMIVDWLIAQTHKDGVSLAAEPEDFISKYAQASKLHQWFIDGYFAAVQALLQQLPSTILLRAIEVACGAGYSTERLRHLLPSTSHFEASEYLAPLVELTRQRVQGIQVRQEDIYHLQRADQSFDLLFGLEVLEHLDDVPAALREIHRVSRYAILGVPHEPWWRLLNMIRGKYWRSLGNTPGHINHWTRQGFMTMLTQAGFRVVDVRSPIPWTIVLVESLQSNASHHVPTR